MREVFCAAVVPYQGVKSHHGHLQEAVQQLRGGERERQFAGAHHLHSAADQETFGGSGAVHGGLPELVCRQETNPPRRKPAHLQLKVQLRGRLYSQAARPEDHCETAGVQRISR